VEYNKVSHKEHLTEYPGRVKIVDTGGGTKTIVPDEGNVIQFGSAISAALFNKFENAHDTASKEINELQSNLLNINTSVQLDLSIIESKIKASVSDVLFLQQSGFRYWNTFSDSDEIDLLNSTNLVYNSESSAVLLQNNGMMKMKGIEFDDDFSEIVTRTYYNLPSCIVENDVISSDVIELVVDEVPSVGGVILVGGKLLEILEVTAL